MKSNLYPEISVIITTFNRKKYLKKAIYSVLKQGFKNFELIILDNNSIDGTDLVIKSIKDERVRYLKHKNITISEQRNLGLSMARANYISFLDDDDFWFPNKLESQLAVFKKSKKDVCLVYSGFYFYNDQGKEWGKHIPINKEKVFYDLLWESSPFSGSASNPMLNKKIVKKFAYNEKVVCGEDWELYVRLAENYSIAIDKNICLKIRQHSGPRLGQNIFGALKLERMIYFRYKNKIEDKLKSRYLQKIAGKYIRLNKVIKGRKILQLASKYNPLSLSIYFQYAFSVNIKIYSIMNRYRKNFSLKALLNDF